MNEPLAAEDRTSFDHAFREHYPALFAFIRHRIDSDAEADDIAQEAYLRVLRYRNRDMAALKALLFQIAANLIGMRLRAAHAQHWGDRVPIEEESSLVAADPPLDRQAAGEQDLKRLLHVVQSLPPKCREAFVLNRIQGIDYAEIALRLGISIKMVEKHVYKGIALCKRKLGAWP